MNPHVHLEMVSPIKEALNSYIGHTHTALPCRLTCHLLKYNAINAHINCHITNNQNITITQR